MTYDRWKTTEPDDGSDQPLEDEDIPDRAHRKVGEVTELVEGLHTFIPEHCRASMRHYIEEGIRPGGFLSAVLSNDLMEAFGRADHINAPRLRDYATFLHNYAPSNCFGSRAKFEAWIEDAQERRALARVKAISLR